VPARVVPRARHALRSDVVTGGPDEPVGEVRAPVAASPSGFALVVADDGTLVGRLRAAALAGDPAVRAEQAMEAGPSTVLPDRTPADLTAVMHHHDLTVMLVTTPEGRLLGVLPRRLAEQTFGETAADRPGG
jgi:CBS domain-containing protein